MLSTMRAENVASNAGGCDRPVPIRPPAERDQVLMTGVGLQIPPDLTYEDWEQAGAKLSGIVDSSSWWLGDWLIFGKKRYSDRYQQAVRTAGLQYQTLRNYAWVARRFDVDRRRAALTFQHHAEVASLPEEEQVDLLDRAEREGWTTKQLRTHIKDQRDRSGDRVTRRQASLLPRIEVPEHRLVWWRRAADQAGVEFDNWMLSILDSAAEQMLSDEVDRDVEQLPSAGTTAVRRSA